jgi:hypothetical protein
VSEISCSVLDEPENVRRHCIRLSGVLTLTPEMSKGIL